MCILEDICSRWDMESTPESHHYVLRHPQPPGAPQLVGLRAGATRVGRRPPYWPRAESKIYGEPKARRPTVTAARGTPAGDRGPSTRSPTSRRPFDAGSDRPCSRRSSSSRGWSRSLRPTRAPGTTAPGAALDPRPGGTGARRTHARRRDLAETGGPFPLAARQRAVLKFMWD